MEDEEVIDLVHHGEIEALEFLIHKYRLYVRAKAKSYYLIGADREDIIQEGMIGLFKAIRDFNKEKVTAFKSFAELCITRQIITAIKTATRQKHIPLNSYVSLDKPIFDDESDRTLMDIVTNSKELSPEELVISKEEVNDIEIKMSELLTDFERGVLYSYLDGQSYKEISLKYKRSSKAIDNALTRVKRKLEKYLGSEDYEINGLSYHTKLQ
jgi:RNA polymerase sporulation-specific sigma factor